MIWPPRPIDAIVHPVARPALDPVWTRRALPCLVAVLAVAACQSRGPEYPDMETPIAPAAGSAQAVAAVAAPVLRQTRTLYRDEVLAVVDGGLGLFLQHVEVDVQLVDGRFRGFRILRLAPPDYWQGVDLRPGDVVERVNGMSIERPLEAHEAFSSLKTADQLVVSYSRGDERRELVYQIKSRPGVTGAPPTQPSQPAPAPKPPAQSDS